MDTLLNSYSIVLISSSLLALGLGVFVFTRVGAAPKWFAAGMAAIALWGFGYGMAISQGDIQHILFWINVEYIGISLLPVCWFVFVLKFTGRDCRLKKWHTGLLFGFSAITILMVHTNPWHQLHYASYEVVYMDPIYALQIQRGPWYYVHTLFMYGLIGAGMWVLVRSYRSSSGLFKLQCGLIVGGTLVPWVANLLVVSQSAILQGYDVTPVAFLITSLVIVIGFVRFRLFDIKPLARDRVINEMEEGWLVIDEKHRIIDHNPMMARVLKQEDTELTGAVFLGFDELSVNKRLLNFSADDTVDIEVEVDGELLAFEVTCKTLQGGNGRNTGRLFIFRDITQYQLDQEKMRNQARELAELNEVKNKLLSIISHDVRGPLSMLTKVIEMHGQGTLTNEDVREVLPKLGENLNQISGFLENLLVWSKSQFEGEKVVPEIFDMKLEIDTKIKLLSARIEEKKLRVHVDSQTTDTLAYADQNMIRLVLRNLLSNAIKFSNTGGTIHYTISQKGDMLEVALADTGVGIAKENMERLFSHETFSTHGTEMEQGTGLGLMLSRDFVKKNKGRIWARSTQGQGSTFYFTVPAASKRSPVSQSRLHSY